LSTKYVLSIFCISDSVFQSLNQSVLRYTVLEIDL
jgi:hypothetical protein